MIAHLGYRPASHPQTKAWAHHPRLVLTTAEGLGAGPDQLLLPLLPLLQR